MVRTVLLLRRPYRLRQQGLFVYGKTMSVSIADLQLLLDVAECGSFSQAAARRSWSQPQVSQRVALLEATLGMPLFVRHRRGAIPTPACETFLVAARQAVDAYEHGCSVLQGTPSVPRLTLACLPSLASMVFTPLVAQLVDAPLEIRCVADHSAPIVQQLLSGEVQVGFLLKRPVVTGLQTEVLWRSPIVAVVAATHPLAGQPGPHVLGDIADERIAPYAWGGECEELVQLIRQKRTVARPVHTVQPASVACELVEHHGAISFLPEVAARSALESGRLVRLPMADLPVWHWEVVMAYRASRRPDPARSQVLEAARALAA